MARVRYSNRVTGGRVTRRRVVQGVAVGVVAAVALVACRSARVTGEPGGELHAAMERFASSVADAESLVRQVPGLSEQDRSEGYRYLAGLVRWALETAITNSDGDHPYFMRGDDCFFKWGMDNPDNLYGGAQISGDGDYLITGTRGSAADLAIQVMAGYTGDQSLGRNIDAIDLARLQINPDGSYQVIISAQPHSGNWLKSEPGANRVIVRQSLSDWTKETPGEVHIRRVGREGDSSRGLSAKTTAAHLDEAGRFLVSQTRFWLKWVEDWHAKLPVNALSTPRPTVGGLPGQVISVGQYQLADDQALVVAVPPSVARYQGFQLGHRWWFTSFDYKSRQTSLTTAQAHLSSDGLYRYVVTSREPGVPNWLDTAGHPEGFMILRWQGLTGAAPAQVTSRLVKLADVRGQFPADEPALSAEQREAQLAARQEAVNRRFGQ